MTDDRITIRGIDPEVWRETKAEAALLGLPLGSLITDILDEWVEARKAYRARVQSLPPAVPPPDRDPGGTDLAKPDAIVRKYQ